MKRKNIKQTFEDDTISTLNEIIPLIITNKGHYAIPITKAKQMIKYFDRETSMQITLSILNNQYNYNTALNYIIQVSLVLQQKTKGGDQECIKKTTQPANCTTRPHLYQLLVFLWPLNFKRLSLWI